MRIKAADDLFSTAVSRIRQTIEALFNWLIETCKNKSNHIFLNFQL